MMLSLDDVEFWAEVPDDVLPEIRLWADVMFVGLYDAACYLGCSLGKVKPVSGDDRKAQSQAWWWIFDDGKTDAGSRTMDTLAAIDGTQYPSGQPAQLRVGATAKRGIFDLNPATGAAWLKPEIAAAEFGVVAGA